MGEGRVEKEKRKTAKSKMGHSCVGRERERKVQREKE